MNAIKKYYDNLYQEYKRPEYNIEREKRNKDFLHKYFLFFLNPHKNRRHDIVKDLLPFGDTYLDVGCWTGDSTILYNVFGKFKQVCGVDVSEVVLEDAASKGIKTYRVDINSEVLPFPDNYFDCITLVAVMEHLVDPYCILGEVRRILKPNGIFIIGVPNVASLSNRIRVMMGKRPRTSFDLGWDGGHLLYFTPVELRKLLGEYNFKIMDKYATGNLQLLRKIFFNITGEIIFKCSLNK